MALNVLVIGAGYFSQRIHINILKNNKKIGKIFIYDERVKLAEKVAKRFNLEILKTFNFTEIKRNKIKLPFLNVNVSIKHDTISKYSILDVITYPSVPHMFVKYCDITYGLDLKQITILWNRYKEYLMGNFYNLKKIY